MDDNNTNFPFFPEASGVGDPAGGWMLVDDREFGTIRDEAIRVYLFLNTNDIVFESNRTKENGIGGYLNGSLENNNVPITKCSGQAGDLAAF